MPPKEKPQPSESQVALLHWWISNNADAQKKVKDLAQTDKIKPVLIALQTVTETQKPRTDIPAATVTKADEKIIDQLKARNIVVLPVAQNTNYLMANFVTDSIVDKADLQLLQQLKPQLIWLKLQNTNIADDHILPIAQLTNLVKLDLSNTFITDKGLAQLATISGLQYLNLVGTKITAAGITRLKTLKNLQWLYLYKTGYTSKDWSTVKAIFPKTTIDTGGYQVPLLKEDTTLVKEPVKKY
jgi:Leucine-rich repeat (LRR) protein